MYQNFHVGLGKWTMKANEITEGWGTAFGSAIGRAVGAGTAADELEREVEYNLPTNFPSTQQEPGWKMGDPINMPDGDIIAPEDGKLYQIAAAQLQSMATKTPTSTTPVAPTTPKAMQQIRAKLQAKKAQFKRR